MNARNVNWDQMQEMHDFCADRAFEQMAAAGAQSDRSGVRKHWRALRVVDVMYADAKRCVQISPRIAHVLREQVLQNHDHPAFRPDWTDGRTRAV